MCVSCLCVSNEKKKGDDDSCGALLLVSLLGLLQTWNGLESMEIRELMDGSLIGVICGPPWLWRRGKRD